MIDNAQFCTKIMLMPDKCRSCNSSNLHLFLNLGSTPLADKFPASKTKSEKLYPLELYVCEDCFLVQLGCVVNPRELFGDDYAFFTGASPSLLTYFKEYANTLQFYYPEQTKGYIVEIASNDGTLLSYLQPQAQSVLGVDPALEPAMQAEGKGIPTVNDFFTSLLAVEMKVEGVRADVVIANNVLAHVPDPGDFLEGVATLLNPDGIFSVEVQYCKSLIEHCEFDHVYHEHRQFFSLTSLIPLLEKNGLYVDDIKEVSGQGGSIRVVCRKNGKHCPEALEMLTIEERVGLKDLNVYNKMQDRAEYIRDNLRALLGALKTGHKRIYGYGASAKSCTLLNFCGIDSHYLDYVVDKTPYKIGRLTPGTHIRVVETPPQEPDYYLLLVWNYLESILIREQEFINTGGSFIVPIPEVRILL